MRKQHWQMQLQKAVNNVFVQLEDTLSQLSQDEYVQPCKNLGQNTIGQHIRHIIELFQCLESGYTDGLVNYENRKRDLMIETNKEFARSLLRSIYANLHRPDKILLLQASYDDQATDLISIDSNYFREIAYNLEHTIHHMALIRIGINEVSQISLPDYFGVASSTIKHRKECAQ